MDGQRGGGDRIGQNGSVTTYGKAVGEFKKQLLVNALQACRGNRTRAARALGLQRTYLMRLIRHFNIAIPPPGRGRDVA